MGFDQIVKDFIKRQRLVAKEKKLLRQGKHEDLEALWDKALEDLHDALSIAWNKEIERLVVAGELEEE